MPYRAWVISAFCFLLSALGASAADRPNLLVVISIDQFRYEYLERFHPYFANDGFRRFIDRGADFTKAYYPYANTVTGPGHATIGTGYYPSESGIVGNDWYDRKTGKTVYCAEDPRVAGGYSPVNLQTDSLGDRLQEKYPGARVYGVAVKDRAAILMAGRKATGAYWFEPKSGFKSSSYYRSNSTLTSAFNATLPRYLAQHPEWVQSSFIPAADLQKLTYDPESLRDTKTNRLKLGTSFPHPIGGIDALTYTPFGNDLVIDFAKRLIETEKLGVSASSPDLLYVGLSSPDYLGHYYGPDSLEVADSAVRTDRQIAAFLGWLDKRFKDTYTIAISADHGVQSIPQIARAQGREAGRVNLGTTAGRADLERNVAQALGKESAPTLIEAFEEPSLYLDWKHIAEARLDGQRVKEAVRDAVRKMNGVAAAFTNDELMVPTPASSEIELGLRRCFRADRSGDVLATLKPGYLWGGGTTGSTHGQFVEEDRHVPILIWGRGVRPGKYTMTVAPSDIARSMGALVDVDAGGRESIVLPAVAKSDVQAVLRAAIAEAPKFEHLIAGERLGAEARATMRFDPAPDKPLPDGYARLDSVEVNGDKATVRLWYGPIPPPPPAGVIQLACGTGYTFHLKLEGGVWRIEGRGLAMC
jgi:arylsulfatase A-like enzyme